MYYFVYILKCNDNSYYTGVTNDIDRRMYEHFSTNDSKSYIFNRRPFELVYYEIFPDPKQAILWEKKIKGWSRVKKEALINENWEKLQKFSECQNLSHSKYFNTEE